MSEYAYNRSHTGINTGQLHDEILNSSIGANFAGINGSFQNFDCIFSAELSAGEQTELTSIVDAHVPQAPAITLPSGKFSELYINMTPYIEFSSTPSPTVLSYYYYPGTLKANDAFTLGYFIHNGKYLIGSSYSIALKMRDVTNGTIIFDQTFTSNPGSVGLFHSVPRVSEISSISNLPEEPALFELTYRLTAGSKGRINLIHIY